ncbi:sensor histidine kinase [Paenibacillus methanolicus]|uniref:Histidine kinase/DNA gyrase B/HSP90-like ATPase n=1 Tax=Paenibacillus methanolicus TaxID=582686 RepID=A0A5S5CN18_9BACL|nr:sensor histidine kinase [Paenibacillus methanolicus]TYP79871.1 histidine kinase/DNA gyrase B/HSP90-like ATPase [Paenibacillus methanolicus]
MSKPLIRQRFRFFRSTHIRSKILISNLLLISLMAVSIGSLAIYATRYYTEVQTKDLTLQLVHQASDKIEYRAKAFVGTSVELLMHEELRRMIVSGSDEAGANMARNRMRINALLSEFAHNHPYLNAVLVRSADGDLFWWSVADGAVVQMTEPDAVKLAAEAVSTLAKNSPNLMWTSSPRGGDEMMFARDYIDVEAVNRSYGTFVFLLDSGYFWDLDRQQSLILQENMAILSEAGAFITGGTSVQLREAAERSSRLRESGLAFADSRVSELGGESYLVTQERRVDGGWTVVCLIPASLLFGKIRILQLVIAVVALGAILLSALVAVYLSDSTTRGIKLLERTMRRVEDGDFGIRIQPLGSDEAGILAVRFNAMLERIEELITTVYKVRLEKQQAEFSVLLAQINPHFLYNTLGTIRWYARMKQQPELERMLASLIGLLKSSVRRTGEARKLEEELADIRSYIELQKIGYGDAFDVRYEVGEDLLPCGVLYLTLQPLVENAILHGIEMSKGGGVITIGGRADGDDIVLTVADNGIGITPEKLASLLDGPESRGGYPGLHSIGVRGVHERIRLYYGEPYGLSFRSEPGQGTEAIVRMPRIIATEGAMTVAASDDRGR